MSDPHATIWRQGSWMYLRTPYSRPFIDALKSSIPAGSREWTGADGDPPKVWKVDPSYLDTVIDLTERFFELHVLPDVEDAPKREVIFNVGADDNPYERMLRLAKPRTMRRIYHLIARDVHPDQGGRSEDMVALNAAWEEVKGEHE